MFTRNVTGYNNPRARTTPGKRGRNKENRGAEKIVDLLENG